MTESAFRATYEQFRDPLFRFGYRLTGSAEVSEDLVHDCFVSLFRDGFDESRGSLKTYLYAAMRNLSRKYFRDMGREDSVSERNPGAGGGPLELLISGETAEAVQRAVEALPTLQREVLVLFEYEELTLQEISRVVDAELAAVKSRLHRARESSQEPGKQGDRKMTEPDDELRRILRQWKAPGVSPDLDDRVWNSIGRSSGDVGTRRRAWLPIAAGVLATVGAGTVWLDRHRPPPLRQDVIVAATADATGFRPLANGAITVIKAGEKQ